MKLIYKKEKNISKRIKEIQFSAKGDANDVGEDSPSDSEENPEDSRKAGKEPLEDNSEGEVQNEVKNEELSDLSDIPENSSNKGDDFEYLRELDPVNDKDEEDFEYLKDSDSFNTSKDSSDFDYLKESDPLKKSEDPKDFDFFKEKDPIEKENSRDFDYLREEEPNLDGEEDEDYDYLREDESEVLESDEENQKSDLEEDINSDVEEDQEQENEREALDNLTKELEEAKDSIYAGDLLVSRSDAESMGDKGFEDFLNRDDHDKEEIEDYNDYLKYRDSLKDSVSENKETDEENRFSLEKDNMNENIDDHKKDTKMNDPFTSESDEGGEEPVLHGSRGQYTVQELIKKESEQESIQDQKNEENEAREEIKEKNDLKKNEEEISDTESVEEFSDDLQEEGRLEETKGIIEEELKKSGDTEEKKRLEEYAEEYRFETEGKRPFYAKKKTKAFEKWLKKKKLEEERLEKENQRKAVKESKEKKLLDDTSRSKKDKKENQAYDKECETKPTNFAEKEVVKEAIKEVNLDDKLDKDEKEHPWSKILKKWIYEEKSEKATKKSKKELKRIIDKFHEIKKKHNRYQWLINKLLRKSISKSEYEELKKLEGKLERLSLKERELFKNLIAFRKFYEDNRFWYKSNIKKARENFTKFLFKKLEDLKDSSKKEEEIISHQKLKMKKDDNYLQSLIKSLKISTYGDKYRIAHDSMLILSKYLYQEISKLENEDIDNMILKIVKKILKEREEDFIQDKSFSLFINKYIKDLSLIIRAFYAKKFKNKDAPLNISSFAKKLIKNNITLNNKYERLRQNLRSIFLYLEEEIPSFELEKINKTDLESDEQGKVCSRCEIKKSYSQFHRKGENGYHSICKECQYEVAQVNIYKKKYRLIKEINNGIFESKCANPECNIDFLRLPVMEIHHPNRKTFRWRTLLKKKYRDIKFYLDKKDKAIPVCRNCHNYINKSFYRYYTELINDPNFFTDPSGDFYSTEKIMNKLKLKIKKLGLLEQYEYGMTKIKILAWLRKKSVIEQLFNGECAFCKEKNISKLEFHHMDPSLKNTFRHENPNLDDLTPWKTLVLSNIKESAERLIFEECICLCGNCHALVSSQYFEDNAIEIISTPYYLNKNGKKVKFQLNGKKYERTIKKIFKELRKTCEKEHQRIKSIKERGDIKIIDQLKTRSKWELTLLYVYYLNKLQNKDTFTVRDLEDISGFKHHKSLRWMNYLTENNCIQVIAESSIGVKTYTIKEKGLIKVSEIIEEYKSNYEEGFISFVNDLKN